MTINELMELNTEKNGMMINVYDLSHLKLIYGGPYSELGKRDIGVDLYEDPIDSYNIEDQWEITINITRKSGV